MNTTCAYCTEVHALPCAVENFEDDRGFSIYDLPIYADPTPGKLTWETITTDTRFEDALNYLTGVAADYVANGDVECYCELKETNA